MGKLYDRLQIQLKSPEYKKDAEDCIRIFEDFIKACNAQIINLDDVWLTYREV